MKNLSKLLWGLGFISVGIIVALNQLEIMNINIFFDGWWTLFMIIPASISLITKKENTSANIIVLLIGIALLLVSRGIISYYLLSLLLVPTVLILIGIFILFDNFFKNKLTDTFIEPTNLDFENIVATFSENNTNYDEGEKFKNTKIDAIFGGVNLDIRTSVLKDKNHIVSSAIFGGVKIMVPKNTNVVLKSTNIFGGSVSKVKNNSSNIKTIYVSSFCLFGGLEIV